MKTLLAAVPVLGCAGMMLVCWRLMRGHQSHEPAEQDTAAELAALREEVAQLRAEQARGEREARRG